MKPLILAGSILFLSFGLFAQAQPDISRTFTFTTATTGAAVSAESQPAVAWRLTYYANSATAFTVLSIQLEGAPDVNGTPPPSNDPSWTVIAATITQGSNPLTDTARGTMSAQFYYPWVRVNLTTLTGSGSVKVQLLGYKGTSAATPATGGPGGPGINYCAPASASPTTYTCAPSPTVTSYAAGLTLDFVPDITTTGGVPATVAVSGLAAKSIKLSDGLTDPQANDLIAGQGYYLSYDGTVFRIGPHINPMTALGDMISGGAAGTPTRVPGNTSTGFKVLAQVGDGTNSALPTWQPPPALGTLTYYLTSTASDLSNPSAIDTTDKKMLTPPFSPITNVDIANNTAADVVLQTFATDAGFPGITFLQAGLYEFHIHAERLSGTRSVTLYGVFREVTAAGVAVGTIGTQTESSTVLTGAQQEFRLLMADGNTYTLATQTSRIVLDVHAVFGIGSNTTVRMFVGGTADSHISLPSNTVDSSNFIPYSGATNDVNLGTHALNAQSLNTVQAGTSGMVLISGQTSGSNGFSVPAVAGTAILYLLPSTPGTAGQLMEDTGAVTCPTLPAGAPAVCHQMAWLTASGTGDVVGPAGATSGHLATFDGATGKLIQDGGPVPSSGGLNLTPPVQLNWTAFNTTGMAQAPTYVNSRWEFTTNNSAGGNVQGIFETLPTPPYSKIFRIWPLYSATAAGNIAVGWSDGTKYALCQYGKGSAGGVSGQNWTNVTTSSTAITLATGLALTMSTPAAIPVWFRLSDDNANWKCDISWDFNGTTGNWLNLLTETRNSFVTASELVVSGNSYNSNQAVKVIFDSYQ